MTYTPQVRKQDRDTYSRHAALENIAVRATKVAGWPPKVRAGVRRVLVHCITPDSWPALVKAVREIMDLIDQAATNG